MFPKKSWCILELKPHLMCQQGKLLQEYLKKKYTGTYTYICGLKVTSSCVLESVGHVKVLWTLVDVQLVQLHIYCHHSPVGKMSQLLPGRGQTKKTFHVILINLSGVLCYTLKYFTYKTSNPDSDGRIPTIIRRLLWYLSTCERRVMSLYKSINIA